MLESLRNKRIMIIVAHPDDELLGLGASMNRLIEEFQVITRVVILGEGITSRSPERDLTHWESELRIHKNNINQAINAIGYHSVSVHNFPDNRFDSVDLLDVIKVVEKEIQEFNPEVIFTHHGGDVNVDHQRTFRAVITACRPVQKEKVNTIITFETPSGTEWIPSTDPHQFKPNLFIEVSEKNVIAKVKGMEFYEFEKRPYPHPRSPEALRLQAQRLGVSVGCYLAEAFCVVRSIQKIIQN